MTSVSASVDYEEEVMPQPAHILLIQPASAASAAASAACTTAAAASAPAVSAPVIYSQRGPILHVSPPNLCPETRSRVIIEAIDALRARKARPDETRITHWVNRRYGIDKGDAVNIIHQSVEEGSVIRVKYKDSISYRNPAKFPRSTAQVNQQLLLQKQRAQLQQQQQLNNVKSEDRNAPGDCVRAAGASGPAAAGGYAGAAIAPIAAIKKILRAIRTLTTKSADPSAGASVQQVIQLVGQRELGFPATFVSRVLKAGVIQGTVRLLPSGNYVLASGSSVKKKGAMRKPGTLLNSAAANSTPADAPAKSAVLIAPKSASKQQTLLQSRCVSSSAPTAAGAGAAIAGADSIASQSATASNLPARRVSADNVIMNSEVSVRRRKRMHIRKLLASRSEPLRHPLSATSAGNGTKSSEIERGRPMSQRKKFKKNLGPDFLEPSDLGMPYLQNSFEPKCDYCDRPASRSPRGKHEDFLICKDCDFKAHPKSCLKYSDELISRCRESEWQCQYCKDCCMCDKSGDVESILFCDACDQGYHMACHNPPLASKPDGAWICTSCQARKKSKVKSKGRNVNTASDDGFEDESDEISESCDDDEDSGSSGQDEAVVGKRKDNTGKILSQLQPSFEDIVEVYPNMASKPQNWSVEDVETFVRFIGYPDQATIFKEQEIDGISLLLLKRSDVLTAMDIKLGPAVKIYGHVQRLQMIHNQEDLDRSEKNETL